MVIWLLMSLGWSVDKGFQYPELMVVPRATERLKDQAREESRSSFLMHHPILVPGATTLAVGVINLATDKAETNDDGTSKLNPGPFIGLATGVAWVSGAFLMKSFYTPARTGMVDLKRVNKKGDAKKISLARERTAETAIRSASSMGTRLRWIAFATNLLANSAMYFTSETGTLGGPAAILGALVSTYPIFFHYSWEKEWDAHREYKKKIYSPLRLSGLGLGWFRSDSEVLPAMTLSASF